MNPRSRTYGKILAKLGEVVYTTNEISMMLEKVGHFYNSKAIRECVIKNRLSVPLDALGIKKSPHDDAKYFIPSSNLGKLLEVLSIMAVTDSDLEKAAVEIGIEK